MLLPDKPFDGIASEYDATRYGGRKARFTAEVELGVLRDLVRRYVTDNRLFVDVACGTGHFTVGMAPFFNHAVGVDLSRRMLEKAHAKTTAMIDHCNPDLVQARVESLPFRSGIASCVFTSRFLHLFPRSEHPRICAWLVSLVRPGGFLIIEHDSPFVETLQVCISWLRGKPRTKFSSYDRSQVLAGVRLLEDFGVSAPGLPTLSLKCPRLAARMAALFFRGPLKRLSAFVVVVYRKL
jgi:ubiquinone/menaquinone biosynthesis C-methylase UbiE